MILNDKELRNREQWESAGFILPKFDRASVRGNTRVSPVWIHFGAGNIFRAFPAVISQHMLNEGLQDTGIIVAEGYDHEIIDAAFSPYDDLSLSVTLKADGHIDKTVVASVVESLKMDSENFPRLMEIFAAKSLQLLSLTITEKGYSLMRGDGSLLPDVRSDFEAGPSAPVSYMGKLAALCCHRYRNGAAPLALVSMDNCSHNGTRLFEAVHRFASEWVAKGHIESGFLSYVENPACLSFPWSMIDKITPRPDDSVAGMLSEAGFEGAGGVVTSKNTYIAPFVNSEESEYLVIEDAFPNGRPPLEKAGVMITGRETVDKTEKMKVCTCLNPLHTGLAVFGCLLSYKRISDMMKDGAMQKLVRKIADEGLPVVTDPKIISPAKFIDTVINVRLPNPFMPDTPQRIATDTSAKISVRFGETIKAYIGSDTLDVAGLSAIPLVLAGWCRYLTGIDDDGNAFELSPDPMLPELRPIFADITPENSDDYEKALTLMLSKTAVFGMDLNVSGLKGRIKEYFTLMMKGPGAVRRTLESVVL
jgi:fructuronate reductase